MVSLSNHVAISLRLNTRRQITIATATRLPPPYQVRGRNDKTGKTERPWGRRIPAFRPISGLVKNTAAGAARNLFIPVAQLAQHIAGQGHAA